MKTLFLPFDFDFTPSSMPIHATGDLLSILLTSSRESELNLVRNDDSYSLRCCHFTVGQKIKVADLQNWSQYISAQMNCAKCCFVKLQVTLVSIAFPR